MNNSYSAERYVRALTRRLGKHFHYKRYGIYGFIYCYCSIKEFGAVARLEDSRIVLIDYKKWLNPDKTHRDSWVNMKPEKRNADGPSFDIASPSFVDDFKTIPEYHNKTLEYLNEPKV